MAKSEEKFEQRQTVTLEYRPQQGDPEEYRLPALGPVQRTLKVGDNELPIGYWHALGGTAIGQDLIGRGVVHPVCRVHNFPKVAPEELSEMHARGYRVSVGEPHPDFPACKHCGHTRESAAAADAERDRYETDKAYAAEKDAAAKKTADDRAAARAHHDECVKLAMAGKSKEAKRLALAHPGNQPKLPPGAVAPKGPPDPSSTPSSAA